MYRILIVFILFHVSVLVSIDFVEHKDSRAFLFLIVMCEWSTDVYDLPNRLEPKTLF